MYRKARLRKEFLDWYDAAGNLKPDLQKKPAIYVDEEGERATKERVAGVLILPTIALQPANQEEKKGNFIEMPSSPQIEAWQSLRILPV